MKIGAGIAGISLGIISLLYVGLFGGIVGSAAGWLGSLGPGNSTVTNWATVVSLISWLGPLLAIAGGIVTFSNPRAGAALLAASACLLWYLLGLGMIGKIFVLPIGAAALLAFLSDHSASGEAPSVASASSGGTPGEGEIASRPAVASFDRAKWNALLQYDKEIASMADKVRPLGQRWLDEFASSYLALNDKTYLPEIEQKIVAAAKVEADEAERQKALAEEQRRAFVQEEKRLAQEKEQQRDRLAQERARQVQLWRDRLWGDRKARIRTLAAGSTLLLVIVFIVGGVVVRKVAEQRKVARTALFNQAVNRGDWVQGPELAEEGVDVNAKVADGRSALVIAGTAAGGSGDQPRLDAGVLALANSQARADQMGDLCSILNTHWNAEKTLNQRFEKEANPLKRDSLLRQLREAQKQHQAAVGDFFSTRNYQFSNFKGVVEQFRATGMGVALWIRLPCHGLINFNFVNPDSGLGYRLVPEREGLLSKWSAALENIAAGDSVTFSGRFVRGSGLFVAPPGIDGGSVSAVMTELSIRGGVAYKVPDELVLRENARHEDDSRRQKIIEGIANQLSGNWSGEWELGGLGNPLAVNKGAFGLDLKRNGSVLTGTYYERGGSSTISGSIDGGRISFSCKYDDGSSRRFVGTIGVTGEVSGRWDQENGSGTWKMAKRPLPDRPNVPTSAPLEGQPSPVVQSFTTDVPPISPVASQAAALPQVAADTTQPQMITQSATVAVTVDPAAQLAGLWVGNFAYGLLPFTVNLRAHSGRVDDVIGDTVYGVDKDVFCAGEIVLRQSGDSAFVLEERVTRRGLVCPGGGTIKMHIQTPNTASIEWYRQKKPDKVAVRATVSRR